MCQPAGVKTYRPQASEPILKPLDKFVVEVTGEAEPGNEEEIKKAVRRYHNRLANGSVPRSIFRKIGKQLFVHLPNFYIWVNA